MKRVKIKGETSDPAQEDESIVSVVDWKPSLRQEKLLKTLVEWDQASISVKSLCRRSGICRDTFYAWIRHPSFLKWFNSHRRLLFESRILLVSTSVLNSAIQGNLQAARLVFELRGELYRRTEKDEANPIDYDMSPEQIVVTFKLLTKMLFPKKCDELLKLAFPEGASGSSDGPEEVLRRLVKRNNSLGEGSSLG